MENNIRLAAYSSLLFLIIGSFISIFFETILMFLFGVGAILISTIALIVTLIASLFLKDKSTAKQILLISIVHISLGAIVFYFILNHTVSVFQSSLHF